MDHSARRIDQPSPARTVLHAAALWLITSLGAVGAVGFGAAGLAGCTAGSRIDAGLPAYPATLEQAQVLDIQVVRDSTTITLTNTTARSFGKGRLWVNRWYSLDIDGLGVGQTLDLSLDAFKDMYGEPFRAGGFFASERPDRLALVQLEHESTLYGLLTVARAQD